MRWESRCRFKVLFAVALSAFGWTSCLSLPAQTQPPDTLAGKTLKAFLDAFDSEDSAKLHSYVKEYGSPQPAEGLQAFSAQTGGFDLLPIRTSAVLDAALSSWSPLSGEAGLCAHFESDLLRR